MNEGLTRDEEIEFHYYNFDPISLYFTFIRIYNEETGQILSSSTDTGIRVLITKHVYEQDIPHLNNIRETLAGLIQIAKDAK